MKSNILALFFWFGAVTLGGLWFILQPKPTWITATIRLEGETNCQYGEIFADPWSEPLVSPAYYYRVPYQRVGNELIGTAQVHAPISLFRFDFCDRPAESVNLLQISAASGEYKVEINPDELAAWECRNCLATPSAGGQPMITLTSITGDPQLIEPHFTTTLDQLNLQYHRQRPRIRKLSGRGALFSTVILFTMVLWRWQSRRSFFRWIGVFFFMIAIAALELYFHPRLKDLFPLPPLGKEIGYVQFNAFPPLFDLTLYWLPLALMFMLVGGLNIVNWLLSKRRKKAL